MDQKISDGIEQLAKRIGASNRDLTTILIFGPPGVGKSHLGSGIGHALIDVGYRVLLMRTSEMVQRLQAARQSLQLPAALAKRDRFDLLILDDISYVRKDQAETSVLFELIAERYAAQSTHRQSILLRLGAGVPRRRHDRGRDRSPGASRKLHLFLTLWGRVWQRRLTCAQLRAFAI